MILWEEEALADRHAEQETLDELLVLDGGYSDSDGHYRRGDVTLADSTTDHSPIADDDGPCVCLLVRNGAARLTGPVARFLNPFIRG